MCPIGPGSGDRNTHRALTRGALLDHPVQFALEVVALHSQLLHGQVVLVDQSFEHLQDAHYPELQVGHFLPAAADFQQISPDHIRDVINILHRQLERVLLESQRGRRLLAELHGGTEHFLQLWSPSFLFPKPRQSKHVAFFVFLCSPADSDTKRAEGDQRSQEALPPSLIHQWRHRVDGRGGQSSLATGRHKDRLWLKRTPHGMFGTALRSFLPREYMSCGKFERCLSLLDVGGSSSKHVISCFYCYCPQ